MDIEKEMSNVLLSKKIEEELNLLGQTDTLDFQNIDNLEIKQQAKITKYHRIHFHKIKKLKDLTSLPKPKEQIRIITQKSFNAYTIILWILKNETIERLYLSSFNISETVILALFDICESKSIKRLIIVLSQSITTRSPKHYALLKQLLLKTKKNQTIKIKLTRNHSKIMLIETSENYYTIEGSGNLSAGDNIEQYILDNNQEVFNFHKNWMDNLFLQNNKKEEILL